MRITIAVGTVLLVTCSGCPSADPDPARSDDADTGGTTGAAPETDDAGESTTRSDTTDDSGDGGSDTRGSSGASSDSTGGDAGADACDPARTATVFVNFDGVTLASGADDAPSDTTQIAQLAGALAPYDGPSDLDEVMAIVGGHFAPFDLCVTRERPDQGPYVMVVVTPDNPFGVGAVTGIAPLDCDDGNESNIAFVFPDGTWEVSPRALANVISSEAATTIGLGTTTDETDILCRSACDFDVDRSFKDECLPLAFEPQVCDQHAEHCPGGGQSSFQEMLARFGPAR